MKKGLGLLLCTLTLVLSACGFHLRGSAPLAPPLKRVYVKTSDPYSRLTRELTQALISAGTEVVNTPMEASTILVILHEDKGQQMLSVGGTQQTRQYNLTLTVSFEVTTPQGQVLIPSQTVSESSQITIESDQVLAGSNEATNIYGLMHRAIIFDIMYRLSSKSTTEKLMQNTSSNGDLVTHTKNK